MDRPPSAMADLDFAPAAARAGGVAAGLGNLRLQGRLLQGQDLHHPRRRTAGAQERGYDPHRTIDVGKELVPTGTQVIQAPLTLGRGKETILRTFAMTGRAHLAVQALLG